MAKTIQEKTKYKREFNKNNYSRVSLYLPKESGKKEAWQAAAKERGISLSELIISAVDDLLKDEKIDV